MRGAWVVLQLRAATACACAVLGCASAIWSGEHNAQYRMPQRFYLWVHVTDPVLAADREGAIAELAGALHRDIWRRGYDAALVSTEGRDRYPRLEVFVRDWKRQSDSFYWFGGEGHAEIDAVCAVRMSPDAVPVFEGRIHGLLDLSDYALNVTGASDAAADAIADEVLGPSTRERVPAPYVPPPAPSGSSRVAGAPAAAPLTTAAAVVAAQHRPAPPPPVSTPTAAPAPSAAPAAPPPIASPPVPAQNAAPAVPTQSFPVD